MFDQPAERNRRARLVEGLEEVVVEGRDDQSGGNLVSGQRDGQGLDQALAQPIPARAGLDLQVRAHLLGMREGEGVRGLGNALEAVRVREPTAGVESADVREPELVVRTRTRRRTVQGVVVNDNQRAVARDVHVELEPTSADLHGLSERGDRVLGSQGRRAPVGKDAGEFRHRCS